MPVGSINNSLFTALSGIQTAQTLLNTTSRNIVNAQTPGYVVKNEQAVSNAATGGALAGPITRFIDASLQQKARSNNADTAFAQARATALTQMDQLSGNPADGTSVAAKINTLQSDFQELAANPQDAATGEQVLNAADDLAQTFNEQTDALQQLQQTASGNIVNDVAQVNTDLQQIASLNQQVVSNLANGKDPTDLQDQRDDAVNDLSKLIGVNAFIDNQGVLQVLSADYKPLAGLYAEHLTYNQVNNTISSSSGQINNIGGDVGGNLQVLTVDTVNRLQNLSEVATQLTLGFQSLSTSAIQLNGTLSATAPAAATSAGTTNIITDNGNQYQATLAYEGNPVGSSTYNLVITALSPVTSANTDVPTPPGVTVPAAGLVLGTVDMSTVPPTFTGQSVQLTPSVANTQPGNIAALIGFTNIATTSPVSSGLTTAAGGGGVVVATNNTMDLFTQSSGALPAAGPYTPPYFSGNIELNPNLSLRALLVGDQFASTASDSNAGAAMAAASLLVNRQLTFSTTGIAGTNTIDGASAASIVTTGQDLSNTTNSITELTTAATQIQQAIAPQSEVSLDTEMGKLVTLQNLYQANARVVSTVSQLLDTLIALPT
ncbi:MAG: flagellar basal body rod C-terminal domain-containing protein [Pseudomonadota bacterium]